eukprot:TRINITY_DN5565_c0_g1_i2.p1 TRINITY_DN5565_c0_g1~~TRINITY_DN5565_c0_g1_i2.p1  ORF type:complete len:391 (-),score=61.24 TRINITY_DN5565_c0_g1_i2:33-1151(-)
MYNLFKAVMSEVQYFPTARPDQHVVDRIPASIQNHWLVDIETDQGLQTRLIRISREYLSIVLRDKRGVNIFGRPSGIAPRSPAGAPSALAVELPESSDATWHRSAAEMKSEWERTSSDKHMQMWFDMTFDHISVISMRKQHPLNTTLRLSVNELLLHLQSLLAPVSSTRELRTTQVSTKAAKGFLTSVRRLLEALTYSVLHAFPAANDDAVRQALEEYLLGSVSGQVWEMFLKMDIEADTQLIRACKQLQAVSHDMIVGIPGDRALYERVFSELNKLFDTSSPTAKVQLMGQALTCITAAHAGRDIGADDLVPMVSYCIANNPAPMNALLSYVEFFTGDDSRLGLKGYALATFQTAVGDIPRLAQSLAGTQS